MNDGDSVYDRIENDSVADAVVAQIENLIISGVLRSGQRLPSERELAEQIGVSRPKIRDAIKILEHRGLLRVQHGEGTFVTRLTGTAFAPAMIDLFTRHPAAFGGYLEFRREVEGFAAFVAAHRATEDDIQIIINTLDDMAEALNNADTKLELLSDVQFHGAIVDATHNPMLVHTMASVYELLARGVFLHRSSKYLVDGHGKKLLEQHQKIGNAIINREADAAAAAAEEHINFVEASYKEAQGLDLRTSVSRKRRIVLNAPRSQITRRGGPQ
ncbi:FadR/GntR family transcriptional regulator [Roseovarius sp. M141]|uniref:FadR/GntR family transcriptional regulator n=1 Tax=Roseovarius sp. M141 TaxID=2583806 RepID=UPI0020CEB33D|nr:FadR/GntR family transcriptional regulator [Roseovarius sp. M141]MCQ0090660.1 FadR family transcriptional regulator [Roseovarius sp. M141]